MTSSYKKSTQVQYYKGRHSRDESKQLYSAAQNHREADRAFVSNMEKTGTKYSKALDQWKLWQDKHGPEAEALSFMTEVSPAMEKLFGQTIGEAVLLKERKDIDQSRLDWNRLDEVEKGKIRKQANEFHKKADELDWSMKDLANIAEKEGYSAYANFINGKSKAYRTSVYLQLANETTKGHLATLRDGMADSKNDYFFFNPVTNKTESFKASEIFKDPDTADAKLRAYVDTLTGDANQGINIQGLNNNIINSITEDKFNDVNLKFISEQQLIQVDINARDNIADISNSLEASLAISARFDGEAYTLSEHDEGNFIGKLQQFQRLVEAEYLKTTDAVSARSKSLDLLEKVLANFVNGEGAANKEAATLFVQRIVSGNSNAFSNQEHLENIKWEKRGSGGRKGFLTDLFPDRFQSTGTWVNNINTTTDITGIASNDEKLSDFGFQPATSIQKVGDDGQLVFKDGEPVMEPFDITKKENQLWVNGELNEKWAGTIQYRWAEIIRDGGTIPESEIIKTIEEMRVFGITDSVTLTKVFQSTRNLVSPKLTLEKLNNEDIIESISVSNGSNIYVDRASLEEATSGLNQASVNKFLKDKNIVVVEQVIGSEDKGATLMNFEKTITELVNGKEKITAGKEQIIAEAINELETAVMLARTNAGEQPFDETSTTQAIATGIIERLKMEIKTPGHKNFIENGIALERQGGPLWFGRNREKFENNEIAASQRMISQELNSLSHKSELLNSDKKFFSKNQLEKIFTDAHSKHSVRSKAVYNGRLPGWVLKEAAKAGIDPWDWINNQRALYGLDAMDKPPAVIELENAGFDTSTLNSLYSLIGDGNVSTPNRTFNYQVNNKLNNILKENNYPELPNQTVLKSSLKRFDLSHIDNSNPEDPNIGAYGMKKSDVKRILGSKFNQSEFLTGTNAAELQKQVLTTFLNEISSEAWDNASRFSSGSGRNRRSYKNYAQVVRLINNRLTLGSSYVYGSEIPPQLLYQGSLLVKGYRLNYLGDRQ